MVTTHFMLPVMMLVNYGSTHLKIATAMKKQEKSFWWMCNRGSGQVTINGISKITFLLTNIIRVNVEAIRTKKPGRSNKQKRLWTQFS